MAEEWAAWSTWRGSPRLVRHVATTAIRAVGDNAGTSLSASILSDVEMFGTPAAFMDAITPEALRRFDRIDISVRSDLLSVDVVFLRRGEDVSIPGPAAPKVQV